MIDKSFIGHEFLAHSAAVEAGRLRFFAKATANDDPIYTDEHAARAAGYPALPAPPSFLFCLNNEKPNPLHWIEELELDLGRILHGEQLFVYFADVCAGDVLTFSTTVADIYEKKNGALEFVVRKTRVTNQDGVHVADLQNTTVQRNG